MKQTLKTSASIAFLFFISFTLFSQEIIFEEKVITNRYSNFGPNMKHYVHLFADVAFYGGKNTNDNPHVLFGASGQLGFGIRYKYKLNKPFSIGTEISAHINNVFFIEPEVEENNLNLPYLLEKKASFSCGEIGTFFRINFGRSGNVIGKFIDLGAFGGVNLNNRIIKYYRIKDSDEIEREYITENNSISITKFTYGIKVKAGVGRNVLFFSYRLNDVEITGITSNLPEYLFGLQIGIH